MFEFSRHEFLVPKRVYIGRGAVSTLAGLFANGTSRRVALFLDPHVQRTTFWEQALKLVEQSGEVVFSWTDCRENNPSNCVDKAATALATAGPIEKILCVGGGSTIDLAKAAAACASLALPAEAILTADLSMLRIPSIVALPTTCGTGAESSPFSVVLHETGHRKMGIVSPAFIASEVVLDPASLASLPQQLIASTAVDSLCHALESFVSKRASDFVRLQAVGTIHAIALNVESAVAGDEIAAGILLSASFSSRLMYPSTGLSIAHAVSHPIGAYTGLHHGRIVAAAIIPSIELNARRVPEPFAALARALGIGGKAESLTEWLFSLLARLPIHERVPSRSFQPEDITNMAEHSMISSNFSSNPAPLKIADVVCIIEATLQNLEGP